jgi:peroxiredoxin Q/BCP
MLSITLLAGTVHAGDLLQPGAPFPSWELADHTGAKVTSQAMAGKPYLLWFYPKAMTPGCTAEGHGLRDQAAAFQAQGVEILGVSFDTPADNATFVRAEGFPFRLLSDRDRKLAIAVGAASDASQPVARRISYLVGPDGKVVKAYAQVTPATHAQDVLADIASNPLRRPSE